MSDLILNLKLFPNEPASSITSYGIVIDVFKALASPTFPVAIPTPPLPCIDQEIAYLSG